MILQGKMPPIHQVHLGVGKVPLKGFCARWNKNHVVLTPNSEEGRLVRAEVVMESRVERYVITICYRRGQVSRVWGERRKSKADLQS